VIINHDRKFLFIHVPKTGGCSIRAILGGETSKRGFHRRCLSFRNKYPDYYKFGFVRNPWARMVSLYTFCINKPKTVPMYDPSIEARGFKRSLLEGFDPGQKDAMWYLEGCDYIGKLETMQKDFDHICEQAGIGKSVLPVKNASDHKFYQDYYDDETIEFVRNGHAKTISLFGYTFEDHNSV